MNSFPYPKLKNNRSGVEIEINTNPFSIGRGLCCNYVIPSKTVSRVHCVLELNSDGTWVLKDTSTNGTFINGELIKHTRSPPLKNNDVISLELEGLDNYVFSNITSTHDMTDEQLCAIADTVLNEMEYFASNPIEALPDEELGATSLVPGRSSANSTANDPLQDHRYVALSDVAKKARTTRAPRPILGCGSRRNADVPAQDSVSSRIDEVITAALDRITEVPTTSNVFVTRDAENATVTCGSNSSLGEMRSGGDAVSVPGNSASSLPSSGGSSRTLVDRQNEDGSSENVILSSSSQKEGSSSRLDAAHVQAQPGPSTDKTEKRTEQPDHYEAMENELQCVICSELFVKAVTLNCSHTFCKYCIGMWNKNRNDCPICRTKITSTTSTIVLDNVIEKVIESSNQETKEHRRMLLEERARLDKEENKPPAQEAGRGRGRGRGRQSRRNRGGRTETRGQADPPRINVLDPLSINIGALANNVIEVSSDSDWSSDTESMSPQDFEDYMDDDWYDRPRPYWGGYGNCFRCGSPNHWANGCPNR